MAAKKRMKKTPAKAATAAAKGSLLDEIRKDLRELIKEL